MPVLKAQLSEAEQTQALLMERYLERHPKVIDNADKIAITKAPAREGRGPGDRRPRHAARRRRRTASRALEKEYASQEAQELSLRALSVDFNSLQSKATVAKSYYMEILDRLNQTTTFKNLDKISLHPLDRATVPGGPISPNIPRITRTSIGLGVIVFLAIAIGLGFIDDRIKSAWDVESFIGVHLLGIIPELGAVRDDEKIVLTDLAAGTRRATRPSSASTARSRSSRSSTSRSRSWSRARSRARARRSSPATSRRASPATARRRS